MKEGPLWPLQHVQPHGLTIQSSVLYKLSKASAWTVGGMEWVTNLLSYDRAQMFSFFKWEMVSGDEVTL